MRISDQFCFFSPVLPSEFWFGLWSFSPFLEKLREREGDKILLTRITIIAACIYTVFSYLSVLDLSCNILYEYTCNLISNPVYSVSEIHQISL